MTGRTTAGRPGGAYPPVGLGSGGTCPGRAGFPL